MEMGRALARDKFRRLRVHILLRIIAITMKGDMDIIRVGDIILDPSSAITDTTGSGQGSGSGLGEAGAVGLAGRTVAVSAVL